jgi:hypothetical protein
VNYDRLFSIHLICTFSKGLNPSPTEAQTRTVDKLAQKINTKTSSKAKKEDEEEALVFDLKSKPRVILFEAAVLKRCKLQTLIYSKIIRPNLFFY